MTNSSGHWARRIDARRTYYHHERDFFFSTICEKLFERRQTLSTRPLPPLESKDDLLPYLCDWIDFLSEDHDSKKYLTYDLFQPLMTALVDYYGNSLFDTSPIDIERIIQQTLTLMKNTSLQDNFRRRRRTS